MEGQVLEINGMIDCSIEGSKTELKELSDLQLVLAGGGCAEVCPY